jgi:hypothetical protein
MRNVTMEIDEKTFTLGREYARKRNLSFDIFVAQLIEREVKPASKDWADHLFSLMEKSTGSSNGQKWTRDDMHERREGIH